MSQIIISLLVALLITTGVLLTLNAVRGQRQESDVQILLETKRPGAWQLEVER